MLTQIARFHRLISPKCRNLRTRRAWSSSYSSGPWTEEDEKDLQKWGSRSMTPVSLTNLMETGRGDNVEMFNRYLAAKQCKETVEQSEAIMMQIACFLHREVPLRIAQRALELQATDEFRSAPHVQKVANMYKDSFRFLRTLEEPTSMDKEAVFASKVGAIYEKHASTLISMARGAHEMRSALLIKQNLQNHTPDNEKLNLFSAENDDIQKRLNEFYFGRIGVRMLIGQYLALREDIIEDSKKEIDENSDVLPRKHIGLINCYTSPYEVAQRAIANASYICQRVHGDAPEVIILGVTNLTFPYIESHLEYILVELLKNSMRATIEKYGIDHMPPIKIVIADGHENEDVVLKVSDEGGGIKRGSMNKIWSYLYTTGDRNVLARMLGIDTNHLDSLDPNKITKMPVFDSMEIADFTIEAPLAGLGYGLPIARNYARYFGGDLHIMSMEGYGTDSFIYLPRISLKTSSKI